MWWHYTIVLPNPAPKDFVYSAVCIAHRIMKQFKLNSLVQKSNICINYLETRHDIKFDATATVVVTMNIINQ